MNEELTQRQLNLRKNLKVQNDKNFHNCNKGGHSTRDTYHKNSMYCYNFVADNFGLQNIANLKSKHIEAWVEDMQARDLSPATIISRLSAVRFAHELTGSKNILIDNKQLDLDERNNGTVNRAWIIRSEFNGAIAEAKAQGKEHVVFALKLAYLFGPRIFEITKIKVEDIRKAVDEGGLTIARGKGGRPRFIPIDIKEQRLALTEILASCEKRGLLPGDFVISDNRKYGPRDMKTRLENWLTNHREKFTSPDRTATKKDGYKPYSKNLTWHGLRYNYAQWAEIYYKRNGCKDADKRVSNNLGHNRKSATARYLAKKK